MDVDDESRSAGSKNAGGVATGSGGGKRGKKRTRAEEDGVVGGLEGREKRRIGREVGLVLEALRSELGVGRV